VSSDVEKKDYTVTDVTDWLESIELGEYAAAFEVRIQSVLPV